MFYVARDWREQMRCTDGWGIEEEKVGGRPESSSSNLYVNMGRKKREITEKSKKINK